MIARLKSDPSTRHVQIIGGNVATRAGAGLRRGRRRGEGRCRAGLDLYDARGGRRGRAPGDRDPRGAQACRPAGVPVIGDGGLQQSGDIAKALVAGADRSALARCSPAATRARATWCSSTASSTRPTAGWARSARWPRAASGRSPRTGTSRPTWPATTRSSPRGLRGVPYRGPLSAVAHQLIGGLQQSMFYVGARTIPGSRTAGSSSGSPRRASGEPPARHPDDRRGAELHHPLTQTRANGPAGDLLPGRSSRPSGPRRPGPHVVDLHRLRHRDLAAADGQVRDDVVRRGGHPDVCRPTSTPS